jgi:GNAT superfamily N-acetyltransferase
MTAATARSTEPSPAGEKPKHKLSELTTYELRDYRPPGPDRSRPVHEDFRSGGLGHAMLTWAINEAHQRGCALVQLTTDKSRTGAHRFYERLGFVASHEGMKLALPAESPPT